MKRPLIGLVCALLLGAGFQAVPASAQPEIPATVQIDDPVNDANYLNDQALLTAIPPDGDHTGPADVGGTSDLMKIWYSNDATTISVHIQLQAMPPATQASYIYRVFSNPGEGSVTSSTLGCLRFFAFVPAANPPVGGYSGPQYAGLLDYCDEGTDYTTNAAESELVLEELADGTTLMTILVPRSYSPKLGPGQVLLMPQAAVQHLHGTGTDGNGQPTSESGNWRRGAQIDNTVIGTDYAIQDKPAKKCPKKKAKKKCPKPGGRPSPTGTPVTPSPSATTGAPVVLDSGRPWFVSRLWGAILNTWKGLVEKTYAL